MKLIKVQASDLTSYDLQSVVQFSDVFGTLQVGTLEEIHYTHEEGMIQVALTVQHGYMGTGTYHISPNTSIEMESFLD